MTDCVLALLFALSSIASPAGAATPSSTGVAQSPAAARTPRAVSAQKPSSTAPAAPAGADVIVTDRPGFTAATSTVGRDRVQLETGYTFTRSAPGSHVHSFPEALLRVGLFRNWFEVRVAQDIVSSTAPGGSRVTGAGDLYVGTKLALSHQSGAVPDSTVLVQGTLPTGAVAVSAGRVLPSVDYVYSWALNPDWSISGGTQVGRAVDASDRTYVQTAQSVALGRSLTPALAAFFEWYALFGSGSHASGLAPQHYFDSGLTWRSQANVQFDVRFGVGLNHRADDFYVGSGVAVRY